VDTAWEYEYAVASERDEQGEIKWPEELMRTSNSRGNIIAPVTMGTLYYVRVRARNRRGAGDWSEAVTLMAR